MMGVDHMVANVESAVVAGCLWKQAERLACRTEGLSGLVPAMTGISGWFSRSVGFSLDSWPRSVAGATLAFVLFLLGSLLPDIDSEKSLLGRFVHIPVKHRRWTHTAYFPLALLVAAWWCPVLAWISLGFLGHLFWDGLSVAGVCPFYPFQKYVEYPNGAYVAKGHRVKLYRTGHVSELAVVAAMTALSLACLFWTLF